MLTVLDLFSGIGGFAFGLESTGGFQTVAFCEIEPFARAVLQKHWPDVPIHEDVRELRGETVGPVDMICGGFPCQDISVAGKGAGLHGARSGLWFEAARLVGELGPRWCLFENVGALRTRGIDRVCSDLEAEGYAVWPLVVGAWAVGAPHRRERVWIVAHRHTTLREQSRRRIGTSRTDPPESRGNGAVGLADRHGDGQHRQRSGGLLDGERAASGDDADGRGERPVGDAERDRLRAGWGPRAEIAYEGRAACWPARPGEPQHEWEEPRLRYDPVAGLRTGKPGLLYPGGLGDSEHDDRRADEPWREAEKRTLARRADSEFARPDTRRPEQPLGSAVDGLPARLARRANRESLKALGNSVVPQVVQTIGRAILAAEAEIGS